MKLSHLLSSTSYAVISRLLISVLVTFIGLLASASDISIQASAQQQQKNEATTRSTALSESTVRGRVVYDNTNRPLRRVRVTLFDPSSRENRLYRMVWTDGRGEFIVKNVVAGKYYVKVEAPNIIRPESFNSAEAQKELTTVSVDGTSSAEVKVRVRRGGAISGKVTYADGDSAINASISILRKKDGQLTPVYLGGDGSDRELTDDRGIFRVSGLPPGEYIVGAAEQKMSIESEDEEGSRRLNRASLSTTYYLGTTNSRSATPVQVNAGDELTDINITLVERGTHSISGTVTMRGEGRPVARARVSIKNKEEAGGAGGSYGEDMIAGTDAQGRWTLDEVQDGIYTITVAPMPVYPRPYYEESRGPEAKSNRAKQNFAVKRQDVTIAGADITGLTIEVSQGGRIFGTVTVDGGRPLPRNLIILPETASGERSIQLSSPIRVQPDGTFTLEGMPSGGIYLRAVVAPQVDNKYYTKAVTANGIDLLREPLRVEEGAEVKGVRIVISPDVATLTGRILASQDGAALRGANLLLVLADPDKQRLRSARLYGFTNPEGNFTLSGAPGEYLAIILRPGDNTFMIEDEFIRARAGTAQRITLEAGERKNIDIIAPNDK